MRSPRNGTSDFYAFTLVRADGVDFRNSRLYQMEWLDGQGFEVVEHHAVTRETIDGEVKWFADHIAENDVPSDGLVLVYDDIAYGESLGSTAKFPRDLLRSSGRTRSGRQHFLRLNGALHGRD